MKMFIRFLCILLLLILSNSIHATPENISQQQAVSIAQQTYSGRVLGVKQRDNTYRVKILLGNGDVKIIQIDARNGKVKSGR